MLGESTVTGMAKNHKLARAMADARWRLIRTPLESQARMYGRYVRIISQWEPTSQTCSACEHRDGEKDLSARGWRCSACGTEHDRDVNAAKSILTARLAVRLNACGAEGKTSMLASGSEAGTHLNREGQPCAA